MAAAAKKDYSINELEEKYNVITELYNLSEELIATVDSPLVQNGQTQLEIMEPLINEISDAADVLTEEFVLISENKRGRTNKQPNKNRIEGGLRKIFNALNDYQLRVNDVSKKAHGALMNIADPIVKKIQRHVEEVIVVFFEFIAFSLASIMNKTQLETVKARDPRIAMMMHQQAMNMQ